MAFILGAGIVTTGDGVGPAVVGLGAGSVTVGNNFVAVAVGAGKAVPAGAPGPEGESSVRNATSRVGCNAIADVGGMVATASSDGG